MRRLADQIVHRTERDLHQALPLRGQQLGRVGRAGGRTGPRRQRLCLRPFAVIEPRARIAGRLPPRGPTDRESAARTGQRSAVRGKAPGRGRPGRRPTPATRRLPLHRAAAHAPARCRPTAPADWGGDRISAWPPWPPSPAGPARGEATAGKARFRPNRATRASSWNARRGGAKPSEHRMRHGEPGNKQQQQRDPTRGAVPRRCRPRAMAAATGPARGATPVRRKTAEAARATRRPWR